LQRRSLHINPLVALANIDKIGLETHFFSTLLEANRNYPLGHFYLAAVLAHVGELDEARAIAQSGLALNPSFSIRRFRDATTARGNNPTYLAGRDRAIKGMRLAGVPEG
jgi:hypothetical protein